MRRRAFVILLFAALCGAAASSQVPLAGFDAYVAKGVKEWRAPGLAIAVVKDGQVVFAQGYGVRELGKPAPVDTHTLFAIGSTTKAMTAALVAMLVDDKKIEWDAPGTRLLAEQTFAELFTPQTIAPYDMYPTTRLTKPHWMTYGLGWFQQDYRGRAVDFHTGSIDGMVAIHGLIRDERLGVYVLSNLDHVELRHALMYTVFDRYAGRSDRDWSADFQTLYRDLKTKADAAQAKKDAGRVPGTSPSLPLEKFAGDYSDPLRGDVTVSYAAGRIRIQYGSAFVGTLDHWHYNTFRATWTAAWRGTELVSFVLDADGRPAALEMQGGRFRRKPAI